MVDFTRPFPGKSPGDKITKQELIAAVRLALCAEEEAVQLYDSIAEYTDNEQVKKLMTDVADEEQVHAGEFQKLLDILEEDEVEKTDEGEKEAEDKIGEEKTKESEEGKNEDIEKLANMIPEDIYADSRYQQYPESHPRHYKSY